MRIADYEPVFVDVMNRQHESQPELFSVGICLENFSLRRSMRMGGHPGSGGQGLRARGQPYEPMAQEREGSRDQTMTEHAPTLHPSVGVGSITQGLFGGNVRMDTGGP